MGRTGHRFPCPAEEVTSTVKPAWIRRIRRTSRIGLAALNVPNPGRAACAAPARARRSRRRRSRGSAVQPARDRPPGRHRKWPAMRSGSARECFPPPSSWHQNRPEHGQRQARFRPASPRQASGKVTAQKTENSPRPSNRAASSNAGSTASNAPRVGKRNSGKAVIADATTAPDQ